MLAYLKAPPTTHVMLFKGGRLKRSGVGLSFFHWAPTSTVVQVPVQSADTPFAFQEVTQDFQELTVQGQLTWRVVDPEKLARLLDFTVDAKGHFLSDDPMKLVERLVHTAQLRTRELVQALPLKDALLAGERLSATVLERLRADKAVTGLGVEPMACAVLSLRPSPEMARALEAHAREALHQESDLAIYARRNTAVAQERRIKESELATELMVEEKKRHLRETKMAADIAVEQQRAALIEQQVANDTQAADAQAYALEKTLGPLRTLDWRVLQALSGGHKDPRAMIAVAFQQLAENAQRIGELNMSPDLLRSLLGPSEAPAPLPAGKR